MAKIKILFKEQVEFFEKKERICCLQKDKKVEKKGEQKKRENTKNANCCV